MIRRVELVLLFIAYALVGYAGDQAAALLADEGPPEPLPEPAREALLEIDVDLPEVRVEVVEVPSRMQTVGSRSCRYEVERRVGLDASPTRWLHLRAGAGSLVVEGRPGLDRVEAVGRACASDEAYLDELMVTLEREGGDLMLATHYPDRWPWSGGRGGYARIDLVVEIPRGMPLDLVDSSGELELTGTGEVRLDDSSGSIRLLDIQGPVSIADGSGDIDATDVTGDVEVEDGSGGVEVRGVQGRVRIDDGSGSITAAEVSGDILVENDGSGSISVRDVAGDFRVLRDGSGGVRHSGVSGTVEIPRRKRR